jgi:hypothetical protein
MLNVMSVLVPVFVTVTPLPIENAVPPVMVIAPELVSVTEFPMARLAVVVMASAPTIVMDVDADIVNPPGELHVNDDMVGVQLSEPLKVMAFVAVTDGVAPEPIVTSQDWLAVGSMIHDVTIQS